MTEEAIENTIQIQLKTLIESSAYESFESDSELAPLQIICMQLMVSNQPK